MTKHLVYLLWFCCSICSAVKLKANVLLATGTSARALMQCLLMQNWFYCLQCHFCDCSSIPDANSTQPSTTSTTSSTASSTEPQDPVEEAGKESGETEHLSSLTIFFILAVIGQHHWKLPVSWLSLVSTDESSPSFFAAIGQHWWKVKSCL